MLQSRITALGSLFAPWHSQGPPSCGDLIVGGRPGHHPAHDRLIGRLRGYQCDALAEEFACGRESSDNGNHIRSYRII